MRRSTGLESLEAVLAGSIKKLGMEVRLMEQMSLLVWDEVVGEQVARSARPEFVRGGKVYVVTKSAVWANELGFHKKEIVHRLNERIGKEVIKDIVFRSGRLRRREPPRKVPEATEKFELDEAERSRVEALCRKVGEKMSPAVRGLFTAAVELEKWKRSQGWTPCKRCGSLQNARSGICPPCRMDSRQ